jgi:hypothetical protein
MSTVDERAEQIYKFLHAHLNEPFRLSQLLKAVEQHPGHKTRAAIRRARGLAEADGLCFPVACPANGQTYCVTNDPKSVVDPAIHLGTIEVGVGIRKDMHDKFMQSRMNRLSPADRSMVNSMDKFEGAQRAMRSAYAEVLSAMVAMRRERRKGDGDA